jgi:hypothetical protein
MTAPLPALSRYFWLVVAGRASLGYISGYKQGKENGAYKAPL